MMNGIRIFLRLLCLHWNILFLFAFLPQKKQPFLSSNKQTTPIRLSLSESTPANNRGGSSFGQAVLDFALASPLWKHVLVPQARSKMRKTAESNGIKWKRAYDWLSKQDGPWQNSRELSTDVPDYYKRAFHAYEQGNLSWDAAMEVELASCAVGARNFPLAGKHGEEAFRAVFEESLLQAGASLVDGGVVVDLGCGTGISTRRLARQWPKAKSIIGIDLSPYFVEVAKKLLELAPKSTQEGGPWVNNIDPDDRIEYRVDNASSTSLKSESADAVQLQFVAHELPANVARSIVDEAYRLLKPGGQFWMCEMDFEAPAFAAQRANPLLFSLIRATEPYLDEYADSAADLRQYIASKFSSTTVVAATGRHYALVATKSADSSKDASGVLHDLRFGPDGTYQKQDTHLKVWENKA